MIALIQLDNGQQVRAKVHQLSATGGVLHIPEPLNESVQVKLLFQLGRTTVRNRAEMMGPIWATRACLQPFRFTNLTDLDRENLQNDLAGFLGNGSSPAGT
ncbi:MAG TPA: hypothetical protein VHL05_02290 [Terriglobales bacterium]|nr:hypothetical protein [Terriglobales bacterium]